MNIETFRLQIINTNCAPTPLPYLQYEPVTAEIYK